MARRLSKRRDLSRNVFSLAWYGDEFMDIVEKSTPEGLFKGGLVILESARGLAPRRSGEMVRSGFVLTEKKNNFVAQRNDRRNIQKIMGAAKQPQTVMIAFSTWYSNLFEDTGRKRNVIPKAFRKRGSSVRKARQLMKSGKLKIQGVLKIPGIGYRAKATIPRMRRRPFLGPAVESSQTRFVETMAKEVRGVLESEMGE